MERGKLLAELRELSDRGHGAAGYVPAFLYEQEILAEFDRLKEQLTELQGVCNRLMQDNTEQKEWLDKISAPIRTDGDIGHIKRTVIPLLREQCKDISALTLESVVAYLDSQKPSEKANHVHSDDSGIFWEGKEADCPICNPKMVSVDWLFEPCPHSTDPSFLATRHECDECLDELLR